MDESEFEARLSRRLHDRFDAIQTPSELSAGVSEAMRAVPRRVLRIPVRLGRPAGLVAPAVGMVVVLVVVAAALGLPRNGSVGPGPSAQRSGLGPASPAPSGSPQRVFVVLPPTAALPSKSDSEIANQVLSNRLEALGIGTFTSTTGNAMEFDLPMGDPSDALVQKVLGAPGVVEIRGFPDVEPGAICHGWCAWNYDPAAASIALVGHPFPPGGVFLAESDDIVSGTMTSDTTTMTIAITLDSSARAAFASYSPAHVGSAIAFSIDGIVQFEGALQSPIVDGVVHLMIDGVPNDVSLAAGAELAGGQLPLAWRGASVVTSSPSDEVGPPPS